MPKTVAAAPANTTKPWRDVRGHVHSTYTGAMCDGPGVRHIVFLQGCLLRCKYCHNPDSWGFGEGTERTAGDIVDWVARSATFLRRHGGVTLSGGEPLGQPHFVEAIFRGCRELGISTALDTNGYLGSHASDDLLDLTDVVLLDIKSWDPAKYRELTSADIEPTLDFARRLAARGRPVTLRYVLVPGLTDDLAQIRSIANFCAQLGNITQVDVLPFHKWGEWKWQQLGLKYELSDTAPPDAKCIAYTKGAFRDAGLVCR